MNCLFKYFVFHRQEFEINTANLHLVEQRSGTISQGSCNSGGGVSQRRGGSYNWSPDGDPVCVSVGGGKGGGCDCRGGVSYGSGCDCRGGSVCCDCGGGSVCSDGGGGSICRDGGGAEVASRCGGEEERQKNL